MSKKSIIVTALVIAALGLGGAAAYLQLGPKDKGAEPGMREEQPTVATLPEIPKTPPLPETTPTSLQLEIDTSDWKTYRNEEYGFEIEVPFDSGSYQNERDWFNSLTPPTRPEDPLYEVYLGQYLTLTLFRKPQGFSDLRAWYVTTLEGKEYGGGPYQVDMEYNREIKELVTKTTGYQALRVTGELNTDRVVRTFASAPNFILRIELSFPRDFSTPKEYELIVESLRFLQRSQ